MAHFKGWAVSLVLAVCCAVCHGDFEQWHWSSGPNLPRLRAHTACVATEDTVYFFGGAGHLGVHPHASKFHTQHNPWLKDVIRFDSATQGYANVTHMEAPRLGMSATYHQGTIYLVGGKGLLMGAVIAYDIQRDSFSAMESMPKGRMFHATVLAPRGRLYVFGGHDMRNIVLRTGEILDLATGRWSFVPTAMPVARMSFAAVLIRGAVCLVGGMGRQAVVRAMDCVSLAAHEWRSEADHPLALQYLGAVAVDDTYVVTVGGSTDGDGRSVSAAVHIWSADTRRWAAGAPLPTPRFGMCTVALRGAVYAFGGVVMAEEARTSAVTEVFSAAPRHVSTSPTPTPTPSGAQTPSHTATSSTSPAPVQSPASPSPPREPTRTQTPTASGPSPPQGPLAAAEEEHPSADARHHASANTTHSLVDAVRQALLQRPSPATGAFGGAALGSVCLIIGMTRCRARVRRHRHVLLDSIELQPELQLDDFVHEYVDESNSDQEPFLDEALPACAQD